MIYAIALIVLHGCDPAWTALFTPRRPVLGRYEVCAVADPLESVAERGWTVERLDPLEAFGTAGSYDRSKLARLYGGIRPLVAHGWRLADDDFTSFTLISPHPDATLSRLELGTLVIRWIGPRPQIGARPSQRASTAAR